ncbi:hypothetical protein ACF1AO_29995 [Streptomyces longwoodensis]|uniref:hypothetical protein n=1 Tax=Streptomyces longwoodensis TaxID=68231 RepID=UPI0036F77B1D
MTAWDRVRRLLRRSPKVEQLDGENQIIQHGGTLYTGQGTRPDGRIDLRVLRKMNPDAGDDNYVPFPSRPHPADGFGVRNIRHFDPPDFEPAPEDAGGYPFRIGPIEWTSLAVQMAQLAASRGATGDPNPRDGFDELDLGDLSPVERQELALETASLVTDTLARLFLRLGPPPEGTGRDFDPVASGGGGAAQ